MQFSTTFFCVVLGLAANQVAGAAVDARDENAILIATSPCTLDLVRF
jgi:hypothetical protein